MKKKVSVLLLSLALAFVISPSYLLAQCADNANIYTFNYNGKSYEVIKESKIWVDAAACAVERGGYLAEINSQAEQDEVYSQLSTKAGINNSNTIATEGGGAPYIWLGGSDNATEGKWILDGNNDGIGSQFWQGLKTGNAVGNLYNNWGFGKSNSQGEPDNFSSTQYNIPHQNALAIALTQWPSGSGSLGQAGQWNDIYENNTLYYIVEYDSLKEGGGGSSGEPLGSGTQADPYQISTLDNLVWLAKTDSVWADSSYFVQTADIDASATDTLVIGGFNAGWSSIGNAITSFKGIYDGGGFTIDGLVTHGNESNTGLFGLTNGLTVKNLGLTEVNMSVGGNSGALVGYAELDLTVDNCYTTGNMEISGLFIGGLIGNIVDARLSVTNSYTDVSLGAMGTAQTIVGGFIGNIDLRGDNDFGGKIEDCYSEGNITLTADVGSKSMAGGFIGWTFGDKLHTKWTSIKRCYATGEVVGPIAVDGFSPAGGFIGYHAWRYKVEECYSTGNVTSMGKDAGGFVGYIKYEAAIENCYSTGNVIRTGGTQPNFGGFVGFQNSWGDGTTVFINTIKKCYSTGLVSGTDGNNYGFSGDKKALCIDTLNYWDSEASLQDSTGGNAMGKTTAEMQTESTFADWDFASTWEIDGNYPNLVNNSNPDLLPEQNPNVPSGTGTEADPYKIATLNHLVWLAKADSVWADSSYFEQTADIDASATDTMVIGGFSAGWSSIGNAITSFTGSYDGGGFKIDGLVIHGNNSTAGLFGHVSNFTVKDLSLTNVNMAVGSRSGALIGEANIELTVENCSATGNIEMSGNFSGGLIGFIVNTKFDIRDSHTDITVVNVHAADGGYAGGFIGYIEMTGDNDISGTIEDCYSAGDVSLTTAFKGYAGGFIARVSCDELHTKWSSIKRCYATGNVVGSSVDAYAPAGGFIGNVNWRYRISECYSTGNVVSSGKDAGGFIGYLKYEGYVENCYSTGNVVRSAGSTQPNFGGFIGSQNAWGATPVYFSEVKSCYSTGSVSGVDVNGYGFFGHQASACKDTLNYYDVETSLQDSTIGNAMGKTTAEMKTESTFAGWNFTDIWEVSGDNYPTLKMNPVSVEYIVSGELPSSYSLEQNYPNPFNPTTVISFALPKTTDVKLSVYNIIGEKIAELVNSKMEGGNHRVNFNASNLASGIYIYRIDTPNYTKSMKMLLLK